MVDHQLLLARGIAVVSYVVHWKLLAPLAEEASAAEPDLPEASVGRWILASPRPETVGLAYFRLIRTEAFSVLPALLDRLETVPEIDPARIAVGGSSTSGFVALEAFQRDPRLAVAGVRVACGDYGAFLRDSSLALNGEARWLRDGELALDPDYAEELREREAIGSPDAFPPRPLLLLAGAEDEAIPVSCTRPTADVLTAAYERAGVPDRFRFVLFEERGHDLGEAGNEELLEWWTRWLTLP